MAKGQRKSNKEIRKPKKAKGEKMAGGLAPRDTVSTAIKKNS